MTNTPFFPATIDEYISTFSEDVQAILQQIRQTIRQAAPQAEEAISYQLPTFKLHGNLVHFGAFKKHIGFYPAPSGLEQFKAELAAYKGAKGSVQFPLDQPVPLDLIHKITEYRVKENLAKAATKKDKERPAKLRSTAWPRGVAQPAQRALAAAGYTHLEQLAGATEADLLALHGLGPQALAVLREALREKGLSFASPKLS